MVVSYERTGSSTKQSLQAAAPGAAQRLSSGLRSILTRNGSNAPRPSKSVDQAPAQPHRDRAHNQGAYRSMDSKTRVAQIGFGYWGPNVLRAISSHTDVEIVVISDKDKRQLAQAGRAFPSAALLSDIDEVIARPDVDALIVALPAGLHFD